MKKPRVQLTQVAQGSDHYTPGSGIMIWKVCWWMTAGRTGSTRVKAASVFLSDSGQAMLPILAAVQAEVNRPSVAVDGLIAASIADQIRRSRQAWFAATGAKYSQFSPLSRAATVPALAQVGDRRWYGPAPSARTWTAGLFIARFSRLVAATSKAASTRFAAAAVGASPSKLVSIFPLRL